jgi:hypothetical protein
MFLNNFLPSAVGDDVVKAYHLGRRTGALMRYSGRSGTVLVVGPDNRLQVRQVSYAGSDDGWVAIRSGLRTGERVVIERQVALRPGDAVVPVSACTGK